MKKVEYKIIDPIGMHARPATVLVQLSKQLDSDVFLIYKDKKVNINSIFSIMSLGIKTGEIVTFEISSNNEDEIISKLESKLKEINLINT